MQRGTQVVIDPQSELSLALHGSQPAIDNMMRHIKLQVITRQETAQIVALSTLKIQSLVSSLAKQNVVNLAEQEAIFQLSELSSVFELAKQNPIAMRQTAATVFFLRGYLCLRGPQWNRYIHLAVKFFQQAEKLNCPYAILELIKVYAKGSDMGGIVSEKRLHEIERLYKKARDSRWWNAERLQKMADLYEEAKKSHADKFKQDMEIAHAPTYSFSSSSSF
jgi:hypothetical protein